jgi:hypothetical protein
MRDDLRKVCEFPCDRCENTTFHIQVCNSGANSVEHVNIVDENLEFEKLDQTIPGNTCKDFEVCRFIGSDFKNEVVVTFPSAARIPGCVVKDQAKVKINRQRDSQKPFEPIPSSPAPSYGSGSSRQGPPPAPWQRRSGQMFPRWP